MKKKNFNKKMGERVSFIRRVLNIKQNQLASIINVTPQQISKYENGQDKIKQEKLLIICNKFNIPFDVFFNAKDNLELLRYITNNFKNLNKNNV